MTDKWKRRKEEKKVHHARREWGIEPTKQPSNQPKYGRYEKFERNIDYANTLAIYYISV